MDKFVIALDAETKAALEKAGYVFIKTIKSGELAVFENKPDLKFSNEDLNILTTSHLTFD